MIQKELEWVRSNVKNKSDSVATGIRDVDDCQPFVMTAPGPGQEGDAMRKQRELGPVFCVPAFIPDLSVRI
jgi:lariat debranching enzyme